MKVLVIIGSMLCITAVVRYVYEDLKLYSGRGVFNPSTFMWTILFCGMGLNSLSKNTEIAYAVSAILFLGTVIINIPYIFKKERRSEYFLPTNHN